MTFTITDTDPRSIKARAILAGADRWEAVTLPLGRRAFRIPSQSSEGAHTTSTEACTCGDARWNRCKHQIAVAAFLANQPQPTTVPATRDGLDRILSKRPPLYETDHHRPTCMLYDGHYGSCSPIDPEPGEPIVGSLPELRCGRSIMSPDEEAAFWRRFED